MPSETTVEIQGSKIFQIKSGHEKHTVCLAVKADGSKMKPFIVIPGKKEKSEVDAVKGAIVKCSPSGWMNDELTKVWVEEVWGSLALCHISDEMKETVQEMKTVMGIIPGG